MNHYPWRLLPRLASRIEHHHRREAHHDLASLLRITFKQSNADLTLWKLRCAQMASSCLRGAVRGGAPSDISVDGHIQFLGKLSALKTRTKIDVSMHRYVDGLLDHVRPAQSTNMERVVAQVRKSMRATLGVGQSLSNYARMMGISEGHLSRCFVSIAGQTYQKERRQIRMEAACRMLSRSQLKITAVARQLGIADPSQFIADFRQEFGVTPCQYRRRKSQRLSIATEKIAQMNKRTATRHSLGRS